MKTKPILSWGYNRLSLLSAFAVALGYLQALASLYIHRILGISPLAANFAPNALHQAPDWLIHRLGVFMFVGGLSTLIRYGSLKVAAGWPASWTTQDCLLWIPRPWYGQIWIALVIGAGAVAFGLLLLRGFGRYPTSL